MPTMDECLNNRIKMNQCHKSHVEIYYTWSQCPLCDARANHEFLIGFKDVLEGENKRLTDELDEIKKVKK